ncbi:hypothetical protein ABT024_30090 [Streptomyces sp. NPDC002812]|uniref:hypothetical protein n=1 Tax=Streptomyces sp. NPDC002812 TaxID=3154434 RepID=UPI00331872C2
MNGFKKTMTAVGTAVVLTAVGALTAPAAGAAPGATMDYGTHAAIFARANNEFIVYADPSSGTPHRVEVRRAGTDKVVAVVDRLTEHYEESGDSLEPNRRWWQGDDQPLVLDEMGDYELDVYSRDSQGKELTSRNAGRSTYALDAEFEARTSQEEFSLDDLDTQVTGSVTAVHPRTGQRLPLAGAMVRAHLGEGKADVVSDAQGKFATSVAALGSESQLSQLVRLASGDTEVSVQHPARIRAQKTTLTLSSTAPLTARYGTNVPLRGTLTRRADDGTVKPAAGRHVIASDQPQSEAGATLGTAGADGGYTVSPRVVQPGSWQVSVRDSWLLGDGTRTATIAKVTHTTKVVEEKLVSTDKYGKLTISGKVVVDGITSQQAPIEMQYKNVYGRWSTRQTYVVPYNKTFTLTVSAPLNRQVVEWRVYTPGTTNIAPSTGTTTVRQTRNATAINGVRVRPRPVAKGQQLTVDGTLTTTATPGGNFAPYPGQKVRFSFRPDGSTVWKEMGTAVTRANGSVGKKFTAETSGEWRIRFVDADANHLASNGGEDHVYVIG